MKFCSGCGANNPDDALVCERCGKPFEQPAAQQTQVVYVQNPSDTHNSLCIVGFVLALLGFNLIAFIVSIVGVTNGKRNGEKIGLGIAGIVISCLWVVVLFIVIIAVLGILGSVAHDLAATALVMFA